MSAPERIWIDGAVNANGWAERKTDCTLSGIAAHEYIRADLCDPTQDERVRALVAAARKVNQSYWHASDGIISGIYELEAALRALEQGEG